MKLNTLEINGLKFKKRDNRWFHHARKPNCNEDLEKVYNIILTVIPRLEHSIKHL